MPLPLSIQWNQFALYIVFVVFGFGVINQSALAEEAYLWIPPEMIQGITYEGVLVLEEPSGGVFSLNLEDSSKITADVSVTILPGSNHGIFKITPYRDGNVTLYVEVDGNVIKTTSQIYSTGGKPHKLEIILSNITRAKTATGFVIITDDNGVPVLADANIEVFLDSSGSIFVPNSITILAGTHYAKFEVDVRGTGMVFANALHLKHGEHEIVKQQNQIIIKMAIAPAIAMENSEVLLVVWFEKDGKPFKPPRVVDVQISSSNTDVVRIKKFLGSAREDVARISMIDGVGFKQISTHKAGSAVISASVQGFGSAQTSLIVGSAKIDTVAESLVSTISGSSPNIAVVWAYPKVGMDKFVGVVSLYTIEYSSVNATVENFTGLTPEIKSGKVIAEKITPIKLDGQTVLLSSTGLVHSDSILMHGGVTDGRMLHAVKFDIVAENFGTYDIFASGPDLERSQTKITSTTPYKETYKLVIIPLPTFVGIQQPLAMICVVDLDGAVLDVSETLGSGALVTVTVNDVSKKLTFVKESCVVLYDKVDEVSLVLASMQGMEPTYSEIRPAQTVVSAKFDVPEKVHAAEEIPFVMHKIDPYGIPLARAEPNSVTGNAQIKDQRLIIYDVNSTSMSAFAPFGTAKFNVELFTNQMRFDVLPPLAVTRIGQNVSVTISSDIDDIDVGVDSVVPVREMLDDVFVFTPNSEGVFSIVFTAKKEGYSLAVAEFVLTVKKIVLLDIQAIGNDGTKLGVGIQSSNNKLYENIQTPQVLEIKPDQINLEFPVEHTINGYNYVISNVIFGERPLDHIDGSLNVVVNSDNNLVVHYDRVVWINVSNAEGAGIYPYGSTVILFAPSRDVYSFLVREVFSSWENVNVDDLQQVSFIANSDVVGGVVYKTDYSGLMIVLAGVITSVIMYTIYRHKIYQFLHIKRKQKPSLKNDW
ncbi:MAG: hypothetical protein K8823_159 [Cenarchaeum symbiont of Oopsacas minuta]|nr:hypothetical protein [Cenarchaeum symbiont of Oopsacas minuta]